jgi:hypothetical protein
MAGHAGRIQRSDRRIADAVSVRVVAGPDQIADGKRAGSGLLLIFIETPKSTPHNFLVDKGF